MSSWAVGAAIALCVFNQTSFTQINVGPEEVIKNDNDHIYTVAPTTQITLVLKGFLACEG